MSSGRGSGSRCAKGVDLAACLPYHYREGFYLSRDKGTYERLRRHKGRGRTPVTHRPGVKEALGLGMKYFSCYSSPIGGMLLRAENGAVTGAWFEGQKYFPETDSADAVFRTVPALVQASDWLDRYFAGERPAAGELVLAPEGNGFRQLVWRELLSIPCGETVTYGDMSRSIAAKTGKTAMSAQAIGAAVGHNPISVIIPCHRVVGANGNLTGYAGGVEKKRWLLRHEGAAY